MNLELIALLDRMGYRNAAVLGPFTGRAGEQEFTVTLYDPGGRVALRTLRGSYPALREEIERLPRRSRPSGGRRRAGRRAPGAGEAGQGREGG